MSAFAHVGELDVRMIWDGVVARAVHADRMTMSLIELEPGAAVPEHRHGQEQVGILLVGSMTFTIGGETKTVGPGATWTILADVPHSVEAGADGAVAFETFSPIRDDWHALERAEPTTPRWPPPA